MPKAAFAAAPSFGARSSVMRDHLYWLGPRGFIYTSPWVVTPRTVRHAAVLLTTAGGEPFEVTVGDRACAGATAAVAPLVPHGLVARDVPLISVHVFPPHPSFRAFCRIALPGLQALDRAALRATDADLHAVYEGRSSLAQARGLFERLVAAAVAQLPADPRPAQDIERLHELLQQDPACSLGQLAQRLGLSYSGASRHFARAVGLPLRSYRLWLKYYLAANSHMQGSTWTEAAHAAGFAHSSHLVRTWQTGYGMAPSYSSDPQHVQVFVDTASPHDRPARALAA